MATGRTIITIEHPETDLTLNLTNKAQVVEAVTRHLEGFASGALRLGAASVTVEQGGTLAAGEFTVSDGADTSMEVSVGGVSVTLTADGDTPAENAALLAEAINGTAGAAALVSAEASGPTVTVTARRVGVSGNAIGLSGVSGGVAESDATLTGGTNPSGRALDF